MFTPRSCASMSVSGLDNNPRFSELASELRLSPILRQYQYPVEVFWREVLGWTKGCFCSQLNI